MTETAPWEPITVWSRPENERAGTPLLVMFHGYGADEKDLHSLAALLPDEFTVAAVRAPFPMGPGFTWFPLTSDLAYSVERVTKTVDDVARWLDGVRGVHSSVSLLGFSMGMAVASSLLRHRPTEFAAVVGLSGFVVDAQADPWFHDEDLRRNPVPFFWGRDQADAVITPEKIEYSHAWLNAHTRLTKVLYTGMMHSISMQEVAHVGQFLTAAVLGEQIRGVNFR